MVDLTDNLVAHIMVGCPRETGNRWIPVLGICKQCEYCQAFLTDVQDGHIIGVRCEYNRKQGKS